MKADIVISPRGEVTIVTREGTFESGTGKIEALLNELRASGIEIVGEPKFEQHRHDDEGLTHRHRHRLEVES